MARTDKLEALKKEKQKSGDEGNNNRYSEFRNEFKDIFEDMLDRKK